MNKKAITPIEVLIYTSAGIFLFSWAVLAFKKLKDVLYK